jgi:hypothetical protein
LDPLFIPFNFRDKNHSAGFSIGGATTLLLSVSSVYSPSLRCKMLLIIPGLFAERGRSIVLWTFSSGLLIDGPIRSIYVNLQRLYDTVICMYKTTLKQLCHTNVINREVVKNVSTYTLALRDAKWGGNLGYGRRLGGGGDLVSP